MAFASCHDHGTADSVPAQGTVNAPFQIGCAANTATPCAGGVGHPPQAALSSPFLKYKCVNWGTTARAKNRDSTGSGHRHQRCAPKLKFRQVKVTRASHTCGGQVRAVAHSIIRPRLFASRSNALEYSTADTTARAQRPASPRGTTTLHEIAQRRWHHHRRHPYLDNGLRPVNLGTYSSSSSSSSPSSR